MSIDSRVLYQVFKYSVYVLLTINVFAFFADEVAAAKLQFADGIEPRDVIEAFAATIDTAAWVVLLLMFELETFVLDERHITGRLLVGMHTLRAICYVFIVYAFYGYIVNLEFVYTTSPLAGVDDLCTLAGQDWSYATGIDEYAEITAGNCETLSKLSDFEQFVGLPAIVDYPGLVDLHFLAWVDVINAGVWLLVLAVLEIDVRLQERNRLQGAALWASNMTKAVLYSILVLALIGWFIKGDFVDWWDALLWLVAFVFIELNVFEWRQEQLIRN